MRIDHRSKSLSFGTDLMVAQKEDVPEGPYIQSMPSEQIRNQLTSMSRVLHKAMKMIQPEDRQVRICFFKVAFYNFENILVENCPPTQRHPGNYLQLALIKFLKS